MIEHAIQKALVTYIGTLGTGWTAYHDHSSSAKVMPRIVVTSDPTNQALRMRTVDMSIQFCWLPDDTGDDTAHDKAEIVRYAIESKGATVTALNVILNPKGINVIWSQVVSITQADEGDRERSITITYRLQFSTGA